MKKSISVLLACLAAVCMGLVFFSPGAEALKTESGPAPDKILLADPLFGDLTQPEVVLSHTKHMDDYGLDCTDCHHLYNEKGENVWQEGDRVISCGQCHNSAFTAHGGVRPLYEAYHANCRECHQGDDKAPKKCAQCHKGAEQGAVAPKGGARPAKKEGFKSHVKKDGAEYHLTASGKAKNLMVFNSDLFKKKLDAPVGFNHLNHAGKYAIKCQQCHHVFVDGKNTWQEGDKVVRCQVCHNEEATQHGKVVGLFQAFHGNCEACHKVAPKSSADEPLRLLPQSGGQGQIAPHGPKARGRPAFGGPSLVFGVALVFFGYSSCCVDFPVSSPAAPVKAGPKGRP